MRIAVYGTGGAGGYFGSQLARAGEDMILIARGEHLNAIRVHGLRLETSAGEILITPTLATDDPAQAGEVDVVLVGVKASQVTEVAERMTPIDARVTPPMPPNEATNRNLSQIAL